MIVIRKTSLLPRIYTLYCNATVITEYLSSCCFCTQFSDRIIIEDFSDLI